MTDGLPTAQLLHRLRNQINLVGFSVYSYRDDGAERHLDVIARTCEEAATALDALGRLLQPPSEPMS
ncbi:MAG TPA: hypothetical protein VGC74_15565 [Stenotrophomonas sp.]|jgi:hypothetical protein